jgi:hypothetical protein
MKTRTYVFVQIKYRRPSTDLCIFISKFVYPAVPPFASRASLSPFCIRHNVKKNFLWSLVFFFFLIKTRYHMVTLAAEGLNTNLTMQFPLVTVCKIKNTVCGKSLFPHSEDNREIPILRL